MKITQFKKMLATHGADFSRWEGASVSEAEKFMATSEQARTLYEEAQALDNALGKFDVPAADPAILSQVMKRMGVEPEEEANVHKFEPRKKAFLPRPVIWGGAAMAMAAAVVLFVSVSVTSTPDILVAPQPQNIVTASQDMEAGTEEVEVVLAEIDEFAEEEIARTEIMGLWQLAEASDAINKEEDIDAFLNELFPAADETEQQPQNEPDLWELFLQAESETQEL